MSHLTAKELPLSERPYEKCLQFGPQSLSDAELLAVILKNGNQDMNAVQLAQYILQEGSLLRLYDLTLEKLMQYPGIGKVKAIQLKSVAELSKRIAQADRKNRISLSDAATVATYYMERLRHEECEHFLVSFFDSKCHLLGDEIVAKGTVSAVISSPREIFLKALEYRAVYLILLHNHPSGSPNPSREDIQLTKRVAECGDLLDIHVSDHIIIGDNNYYSFRENRML